MAKPTDFNISAPSLCRSLLLRINQQIVWNAYCVPTSLEESQVGIKIAGEISITSDMQMTPPLWQKVKKN